ncbi:MULTISPECIES: hypothetical protein [unclassified Bradyrhizobium]|uniref:hypothetical protein n=1 Tax=unclassified Bradyrhizobium TaxID=2631580 RepID=UPI0024791F64|nr:MULTISPECIES: hypothetical protein [unclassified Bradyrhizobium]WGR70347.1 hypothetical protein MTX24_34030 [Bradyrhizobium sp. ISRA426]WGR82404.1 hypothetical protein MTX21_19135 [Bradyrhizobium sp. ISRA430]WGR85590.1 hypothetical protein MTX25_33715 [Bradyrhizobium sp. ISRA432]
MNLHELKLLLQRHFSDGLVTVVGSGLSCAEGLPGMGALAAHLQSTIETDLSADDKLVWSELSPQISAKGFEAALLARPPTSTLEAAIVAKTAELIARRMEAFWFLHSSRARRRQSASKARCDSGLRTSMSILRYHRG